MHVLPVHIHQTPFTGVVWNKGSIPVQRNISKQFCLLNSWTVESCNIGFTLTAPAAYGNVNCKTSYTPYVQQCSGSVFCEALVLNIDYSGRGLLWQLAFSVEKYRDITLKCTIVVYSRTCIYSPAITTVHTHMQLCTHCTWKSVFKFMAHAASQIISKYNFTFNLYKEFVN